MTTYCGRVRSRQCSRTREGVESTATERLHTIYDQGSTGDVRAGKYHVLVLCEDIAGGLVAGAGERCAGDRRVYAAGDDSLAAGRDEEYRTLVRHGDCVAVREK